MKKQDQTTIWYSALVPSPVGKLTILCDDHAIKAVLWENDKVTRVRVASNVHSMPLHPLLKTAEQQLKEYFSGHRTNFELPLSPSGTPFQIKVWDMLRRIPYGKTWDYKTLARKIGNEKASRAVGAANGRNPISIFIPCHRVIGSHGSMTGFAGGIAYKEFLIALEKTKV